MIEKPQKQLRQGSTKNISFEEEDSKGVLYPYDNKLVVTLLVANYTTQKILIDNENLADILFWDALIKMGIDSSKLHPTQ